MSHTVYICSAVGMPIVSVQAEVVTKPEAMGTGRITVDIPQYVFDPQGIET